MSQKPMIRNKTIFGSMQILKVHFCKYWSSPLCMFHLAALHTVYTKIFVPLNLYRQYYFHADIPKLRLFLPRKTWSSPLQIPVLEINGKITLHHSHTPSQNTICQEFEMNTSVAEK